MCSIHIHSLTFSLSPYWLLPLPLQTPQCLSLSPFVSSLRYCWLPFMIPSKQALLPNFPTLPQFLACRLKLRFIFNSITYSRWEMILTLLFEDSFIFLPIPNPHTISCKLLSPSIIAMDHPFLFIPMNTIFLTSYNTIVQSLAALVSPPLPIHHQLFKFIAYVGPRLVHVYI